MNTQRSWDVGKNENLILKQEFMRMFIEHTPLHSPGGRVGPLGL